MASDSSEGSLFDQTVPPWKKELLLRKKLHGRGKGVWSIQLNNKYGAEDFHPVRNMRLLTKEPSDYINSNVEKETKFKMIEDRIMKRHSSRLNKLQADYLQSIKNVDLNGKDDVDGGSDSSEELQYGPGIVNKLKSKYLSMTLRDNHKYSSRPSLANLRRATSLENMLEDESKNQPKSHFIKKSSSPNWPKGNKISQHHAKYLGISKGESMKRARSMDTLFKNEIKNVVRPNGMTQSVIANEDLVIVDRDTDFGVCKSSFPDDKELPPPDVVKQTKKIFEKTSDALNSDNKNKKTVLSKANNLKVGSSTSFYDKQLDRVKPQLGPKPVFSGENKRSWPNKRIYPVVTSKPSPPPSPVKSSPRPDVAPRVVGIDTKPRLPSVTVKPQSSDGPASPVRATFVPVDDGRPSSPSKDGGSPVSKFIGDNALSSYFPRRNLMQATNPCLIKHQSSESASQSVKQVAVIRPIPAKKPLTEQEIENNLINSAKNNKKNPVDDSAESSDSEQVQAWEKKSWQSANSMVFNFSSRPSVPDYIENDGLAVSNRVAPKNNTNRDEVDVDEDWEAPQFCDVSFVGDNVLINGKSNLRKESTPTKVQSRRIQFNDEATTLYEYPSEDSLIEDTLSEPQSPQTSPQPPTPSPSPLGGATLSRYISSKSPTPTDFELGVTSSASVLSHSQHSVQKDQQRDEFVKLADCETAWSQETTSDILF